MATYPSVSASRSPARRRASSRPSRTAWQNEVSRGREPPSRNTAGSGESITSTYWVSPSSRERNARLSPSASRAVCSSSATCRSLSVRCLPMAVLIGRRGALLSRVRPWPGR
jgi:hypothetical protein